jgi:hypothetical protein
MWRRDGHLDTFQVMRTRPGAVNRTETGALGELLRAKINAQGPAASP